MNMTPFYNADWHQGYGDARNGFPRALGGTHSGYRAGYDRGLTDSLAHRDESQHTRDAFDRGALGGRKF